MSSPQRTQATATINTAPDGISAPTGAPPPADVDPGSKTPQKADPRLEEALGELKKCLNKTQRAEFAACTKEDVERAIKSIQETLGKQRRLQNFARLTKVMRFIGRLAIVAGELANGAGQTGFFWAPIRYVLDQAIKCGDGGDCIDKVVGVLSEIANFFPTMEDYDGLYSRHPTIRAILDECCQTVIKFHTELVDVFSKKGWSAIFRSSWRRFLRNTESMKVAFQRNSELLSEAKQTATMRMTHENQQLLERMHHVLDDLRTTMQVSESQNAEQRLQRLREVINKLAPAPYLDDQTSLQSQTHPSASGKWLFTDARFTSWVDFTDERHMVLDLNGCPGAGKSFLVSGIVKHLQSLQENSADRNLSLAYFYFKHNSDNRKTFQHALQAVTAQLVAEKTDQAILDHAFEVLSAHPPSKERLKRLASTALQSKRVCFVVLDAIDECQDVDQAELFQWLRQQIIDQGDAPFTLRIILSSRRVELYEKEIASIPSSFSISIDNSLDHDMGIRAYVEAEAEEMRKRFGLGHDVQQEIVTKIMSQAKGMFLFASVAVQYLSESGDVRELKDELQSDLFSEGQDRLDKAYNRVACRIFETGTDRRSTRRQARAKQLLSWVSCAYRPLYWREVQARFMIDVAAGPDKSAHESLSHLSPKELCSCFIDVADIKQINNSALTIVHRTASEYLQRSGRLVSAAEQHAEMLTFCCKYLKSPAFSSPVTPLVQQDHARTGYYAFYEYAAAHCYDQTVGPAPRRPGGVTPLLTTFAQRNHRPAGTGLHKGSNT